MHHVYCIGGAFTVSHAQETMTVDFSTASRDNNMIQWVAFYGDCVHEVQPVVSGHRLTLSFELFFNMNDKPSHTHDIKLGDGEV